MLMGIYGDLGSGKTILSVNYAVKVYNANPENDLRANFKIDLPNFKYLEVENLLDIEKRENPNTITQVIGDELYTWLESRVSPSKLNRFVSYILFQSRKRNIDIYGTAQLKSTIDLRFKDLEHITVYAFPRNPKSKDDFNYGYIINSRIVYYKLPYDKCKKLFDLYDSDEIVEPPDIEQLREEIVLSNPKKIKEKLNLVIKKIDKSGISLTKITHDSVKDLLIEIEESMVLEPYLYSRLKNKESLIHGD
jgi:hypothetical protein